MTDFPNYVDTIVIGGGKLVAEVTAGSRLRRGSPHVGVRTPQNKIVAALVEVSYWKRR